VQVSQTGNFVFVVDGNDVVHVRHVTTGRQVSGETVIASGLASAETVVTDGQLRLSNGTHVSTRTPKKRGASPGRAGT
jgi:multidrug efflux system membrane fusion protein